MTPPTAPGGSRSHSDPEIHLRPAQGQDQPRINSLIRKEHLNPLSLNWRHFWLAETQEGEIIGCGQIKPHGDGSRELASLVVVPAWRRRGVAGAIISKLKADAEAPLWLTCRSELIVFYEKFGFMDRTSSPDLPPYFRRIRRLAGALIRLARPSSTLAIMCWEG